MKKPVIFKVIILGMVLSFCFSPVVLAKGSSFQDVKEGAFYYDSVDWAVTNEITKGLTSTQFGPDATCTRGQVVTFLWRACGSPDPQETVNGFTDVKSKDFYYKAVLWAVENNITKGVSKNSFAPGDGCTRAQVVTFLFRTIGATAPGSSSGKFEDVDKKGFYADAVSWAVNNNITNGTDKTHFSPNATCTRGQIVTFLFRTDSVDGGFPKEHIHTDACRVWVVDTPYSPAVYRDEIVIDRPYKPAVYGDIPVTVTKGSFYVWISLEYDNRNQDLQIAQRLVGKYGGTYKQNGGAYDYTDTEVEFVLPSEEALDAFINDEGINVVNQKLTFENGTVSVSGTNEEYKAHGKGYRDRETINGYNHEKLITNWYMIRCYTTVEYVYGLISPEQPESSHVEKVLVTPEQQEVGHWEYICGY